MRHIRRRLTIAVVLACIGTTTAPARAQGWAETWFDNVTYTWNGNATITRTDATTSAVLGTSSGSSISVDTTLGGHFTFYFAASGSHVAGEWAYSGPQELAANANETFTYALTDRDGDVATAALTVAVTAVNDAPVNTVPAAQTVAEDASLV